MSEFWTAMFYLSAGLAIPPFVIMYVAWIALRMKKLRLARWRKWQRLWFYLGVTLLGMGAIFHLLGPAEADVAAYTALLGGMLNSLISLFQGRIVDVLTRPPRDKR